MGLNDPTEQRLSFLEDRRELEVRQKHTISWKPRFPLRWVCSVVSDLLSFCCFSSCCYVLLCFTSTWSSSLPPVLLLYTILHALLSDSDYIHSLHQLGGDRLQLVKQALQHKLLGLFFAMNERHGSHHGIHHLSTHLQLARFFETQLRII